MRRVRARCDPLAVRSGVDWSWTTRNFVLLGKDRHLASKPEIETFVDLVHTPLGTTYAPAVQLGSCGTTPGAPALLGDHKPIGARLRCMSANPRQ
jgi:hypothetical protein